MTHSLYHLFYGGEEYGQIKPELWNEEKFSISVNNKIIKAVYPNGQVFEFPVKANETDSSEYNEAYIIQVDYNDNDITVDKKVIKEIILNLK